MLACSRHDHLACGDQHLFGGERDGLARLQCRQSGFEGNRPAERDDGHIHIVALHKRAQPLYATVAHIRERTVAGRLQQSQRPHAERLRLRQKRLGIAVGRQPHHLQAFRQPLDDLQGLLADGACGTQH
jgi:hypothetical protein